MKNTLFASFVALISASAVASAQEAAPAGAQLGGSIGVEVSENAAGDYVAETTLGFGISAETGAGLAFGGFEFESIDGGNLTIDSWQIGLATNMATLTFGDQGDIFVGNGFNIVGGDTLANPASDHESLIVDFGNAAVMVGFTDITADITEIENVQGSLTADLGTVGVTGVVDYNLNSEDYTLGADVAMSLTDMLSVGTLVTYSSASEAFGYEASAGYGMVSAFVNGDDTDMLQNVGAGISHDFNGFGVYAEGAYNIDAQDTTFGAGVNFSF